MYCKTLIGGALAAVVGLGFFVCVNDAGAEEAKPGRYQIAPQANTGNVWQLDTSTGALRLCLPPGKQAVVPECLAWGQPAHGRMLTVEEVDKRLQQRRRESQ